MLPKSFCVAPYAGIVDNNSVINTKRGVVDCARVVSMDELNNITVRNHAIILFVRPYGALKRTMDGVATQKFGSFFEVFFRVLAYDNGPEPQLIAPSCFLDEEASQ